MAKITFSEQSTKQHQWTPKGKNTIVLQGLKGEISVAELCNQHQGNQRHSGGIELRGGEAMKLASKWFSASN